jgi:hypothetical protein
VVGPDEIVRVVDAVDAHGAAWREGAYEASGAEYFVDLETEHGRWHAPLGFDARTLACLDAMTAALDGSHRQPLLNIVSRVRGDLGGRSAD